MVIEHISNNLNNWQVLKVNGNFYYDGDNIPAQVWLDLLSTLGNVVVGSAEVSYEDMKEGNY